MSKRLQRKINAFESLLEEDQRDSFNSLKGEFNFVVTEKELVSALEGLSRPVVRIDRSYDIADELDIELGSEGHEIIDTYEESLDEFFDPVEGWLEEEFEDHSEDELGWKAEGISQIATEAEAVADEYEREIDLALSNLPEKERERIVERHDFEYEDPNTRDNWGYGFLNLVYDIGSFARTKITGRDSHRYEDSSGNAKALPQDEEFSRRAFIGMGKEALAVGALGALGYAASEEWEEHTSGNGGGGGQQPPQNGRVTLSVGETYNLSEVEPCAADYQMEQTRNFLNDRGLSEDDVRVELTNNGEIEVLGETGNGNYDETLYITDSVAQWTCDLE
ncbi:hypothetical protein [Candidatus Nanohalovita haloferacivicina]|uniref:hypothetical protein n=1 Tax=Candidatus Nanohalovita haloferacivicina TaxID=2978046 RepID=UPI00325FC73F|nr:hypothetical protein HBNXNv_1100 [Candidatus Nanohalobia archaeon BNXNv]